MAGSKLFLCHSGVTAATSSDGKITRLCGGDIELDGRRVLLEAEASLEDCILVLGAPLSGYSRPTWYSPDLLADIEYSADGVALVPLSLRCVKLKF